MRKLRLCSVDGCGRKNYARQGVFERLCKRHYTQVQRHGRLTPEKERGVARVCVAPDCDRTDVIGGRHCRKHARQIRTHGRLTPEREHDMAHVGCSVKGCTRPHRAKGLCVTHFNQARWLKIKSKLARLAELEAKIGPAEGPTAP